MANPCRLMVPREKFLEMPNTAHNDASRSARRCHAACLSLSDLRMAAAILILMAGKLVKLYCYVDESGQHTATHPTKEHIFVVASAVFQDDRREIAEELCLEFENASGKRRRKWNSCGRESRMTYVKLVIEHEHFRNALSISTFRMATSIDYDMRTILSITKAIVAHRPDHDEYTSDIFIDGISRTKQTEYANELRKLGVRVRRIHQARDESHALIRLADAFAGLVREAEQGQEEALVCRNRAQRKGVYAAT